MCKAAVLLESMTRSRCYHLMVFLHIKRKLLPYSSCVSAMQNYAIDAIMTNYIENAGKVFIITAATGQVRSIVCVAIFLQLARAAICARRIRQLRHIWSCANRHVSNLTSQQNDKIQFDLKCFQNSVHRPREIRTFYLCLGKAVHAHFKRAK